MDAFTLNNQITLNEDTSAAVSVFRTAYALCTPYSVLPTPASLN